MRCRTWIWGFSAAALAAGIGAPAYAADGASATVEEIVVTANKREQSIYDVPTSVTAVSADSLRAQGVSSLMGMAELTPGLSFFSRGAAGTNQVILRGLTSGSQQTSPTVGFYVNDTPFGFSIPVGGGASILQPDLDPSDIDRIEILRGPQGTLYGASTLGGLIKYVTKSPNAEQAEGAAQVGLEGVEHGGDGFTTRAMLNVPLQKDRLALRLSAFDRTDPGFVDNTQTGQKDVNRNSSYGGRVALGFYPTETLSIVLSGLGQVNRTRALGDVTTNPTTLAPLGGDLTQQYYINQGFNTDYKLGDVEVTWKLPGYTLVSSTSASQVDLHLAFDFTRLLPPGFLGATYYTGPQNLQYKKFAQEIRAVSPSGGVFEWIGGLYYTAEDVKTATFVNGYAAGGAPAALAPIISKAGTTAHYEEMAAFGNLTYNLTRTLGVTVGARVAENRVNDQILSAGLLSGTALNAPNVQNGRQKENVATYLAAVNWRYAPTGSLFARIASGYRPGGPVEPPVTLPPGTTLPKQFNSDSVWNYELGGRSTWAGGKLAADYSAFYIKWDDIQLPFLVNGFRVLSNGGGASSQGFEFDGRWMPTNHLTLGVATAFADAKLTSDAPLVFGHKGDALPFSPKWSTTLRVDYVRPLAGSADLSLGGSYHYDSGRNSALSPADSSFARLKAFASIDLHGGVTWDRYELVAFLRNALDERGYASGGVSAGRGALVPIQPRTVGFTFGAKF